MTESRSPEADAALVQAIATRPAVDCCYVNSQGAPMLERILLSVEERDRICAPLTARMTVRSEVHRRREVAAQYLDHPLSSAGAYAVVGLCDALLALFDEWASRVPAEGA